MTDPELELETTKSTTAEGLRTLLRRKFPADQYAMLYEVRDAAGFSARRSADVLMVGLWPSRGCQIEGMEIKISRSDWLREIKEPKKAEAFVPYCDRWWIVANPGVVKKEELPPTWGLITPSGKGLGVIVQAPALTPKPIDRSLLAAILKRATSTAIGDPEVQAAIEAKVKAAKEGMTSTHAYQLKSAREDVHSLERSIAEFEKASGVKIGTWNGERIGEAVAAVMRGEHDRKLREIAGLKSTVLALAEYMKTTFPDAPEPEVRA